MSEEFCFKRMAEDLYKASKEEQISYAVTYGEFMYQAGSWEYPRRVVFKIEKPSALAAIFISFNRMVSTCCFRIFAGSTSRLNQLNKLYASM